MQARKELNQCSSSQWELTALRGLWSLPEWETPRVIRAGRNLHLALLGKQILCILQCSCG